MKKILLLSFLLGSLLTACRNDDNEPAPGERPDERLSKVLADYKTQLVNAENGWIAVLYPKGRPEGIDESFVGAYSFWFKFAANDRVTMTSDVAPATTVAPLQSTFRLKALQRPSLLFDTYNYLHILADPDPSKSNGATGAGKFSDFEFSLDSVSANRMVLTGNFLGSKMVLIRATPEDAANFINRVATTATTFEKINTLTTYFKRLTIGSIAYDINVNANLRSVTFSYFEGGILKTFTTTYYYTPDGVVFLKPFSQGNQIISGFTAVQFAEATKKLSLTVNNVAATVQEATRPVQVDLQAPRRFFNNPPNGSYWVSGTSFTVSGVPDALNITTIPDYFFLVYWPKFGQSGTSMYDLLGFVSTQPAIEYGPAALPRFTQDGRIIYNYLGMLGADNIPAQYAAIITATQEAWTEPNGFFAIQTGPNSYDLVSAKDAKTWISFE